MNPLYGQTQSLGSPLSQFDPLDHRYRTCRGKVHVVEAAKWVTFGQSAVAVVEIILFIAFYLVDWTDPSAGHIFDTRFLILGICLFAMNVFFVCILYAGIRYENSSMIVVNLGWMAVSASLRGLSIVLLIVELIYSPHSALWLSPGLVATVAALAIQCLSCYALARCASFMKDMQRNRRRIEALAAARLLVQYWRAPQQRYRPPPSYEIATITVPAVVTRVTTALDESTTSGAQTNTGESAGGSTEGMSGKNE